MAQETFTKEQFWSELDALGEEEVRVRFSVTKQFGDVGPKHELTKLWLSDRAEARHAKREARRDRRENITLTVAIAAAIIAAIAARADIKWLISSVISWLSS